MKKTKKFSRKPPSEISPARESEIPAAAPSSPEGMEPPGSRRRRLVLRFPEGHDYPDWSALSEKTKAEFRRVASHPDAQAILGTASVPRTGDESDKSVVAEAKTKVTESDEQLAGWIINGIFATELWLLNKKYSLPKERIQEIFHLDEKQEEILVHSGATCIRQYIPAEGLEHAPLATFMVGMAAIMGAKAAEVRKEAARIHAAHRDGPGTETEERKPPESNSVQRGKETAEESTLEPLEDPIPGASRAGLFA